MELVEKGSKVVPNAFQSPCHKLLAISWLKSEMHLFVLVMIL